MSDGQINIAIAKACGLTIVSDGIMHHLTPCGKKTEHDPEGCLLKECPDYCKDLNAMHEAEKRLLSGYWMRYCECLNCLLGKSLYASVHATARQRAEAFLRTLGKWEDVR